VYTLDTECPRWVQIPTEMCLLGGGEDGRGRSRRTARTKILMVYSSRDDPQKRHGPDRSRGGKSRPFPLQHHRRQPINTETPRFTHERHPNASTSATLRRPPPLNTATCLAPRGLGLGLSLRNNSNSTSTTNLSKV
jgi:hypothetical protein